MVMDQIVVGFSQAGLALHMAHFLQWEAHTERERGVIKSLYFLTEKLPKMKSLRSERLFKNTHPCNPIPRFRRRFRFHTFSVRNTLHIL